MDVVLVEPEIPQNTGSIGRLCAATRSPLHLVGRLGFSLDDKYMKRAGLDYWPLIELHTHSCFEDLERTLGARRRIAFSARSTTSYSRLEFREDDVLIFGGESRGLPSVLCDRLAPLYTIPIFEPGVRSLNLSNAVSIVLYEGLRQLGRV